MDQRASLDHPLARLADHFVGIDRLDQIARRDDTVCVLNILGQESRVVTPVSHAFSGGNVVFGTSPGRAGKVLKTEAGDIPVYNDVHQGISAGHSFNTGVVYLPPPAVRDGVAELAKVNPGLTKLVIVTEKVSLHHAREIRAIAQRHRFDVFGANALGIADSWERVRIGGALGGDEPQASLVKGSVAVFSNSGNFTSTIATYLAGAGWGTTTLISSGKDLYIHFAAPEFIRAFNNDERSRAAVLYVEPGGYYEQSLDPRKPVIACVVGRWKSHLTYAVGHAGAMAGSGDDAFAKESWFLDHFGCNEPFTPDRPVCSARGALVLNIAHIPAALDAVMRLNGQSRDFPTLGDLALKPWFGNNQGLALPPELDLPLVEAPAPYSAQVSRARLVVGARFPRQTMRDASGATQIDTGSQTARLHGVSIIDAAGLGFSASLGLALLRERPDENVTRVIDAALQCHVTLDPIVKGAAEAARAAGNSPNVPMMIAAACLGPDNIAPAQTATMILTDTLFERLPAEEAQLLLERTPALFSDRLDRRARSMIEALGECNTARRLRDLVDAIPGQPTGLMALALCSAFSCEGALRRKRISLDTVGAFPWHLALAASMIGSLGPDIGSHDLPAGGFQQTVAQMLTGHKGDSILTERLSTLLGLLATNGPGTISAQGAKAAVSADGPEDPDRVLINKAYIGFLASSGYAHGGNGYEGVRFLLDCFEGIGLSDPGGDPCECDVEHLATRFAKAYRKEKDTRSDTRGRRVIPGINHPVFRGKAVNVDPREEAIWTLNGKAGRRNVFHDFYRALVRALHREGATSSVFCVNIDGVIAAELLAALWPRMKSGSMSEAELETCAFAVFLVARIVGVAAEIEDHRNRGMNLDMRVPQDRCRFVA